MKTDINQMTSAKSFISEVLLHLNISLSSYQEFPENMIKALKTIGEFSHHDRIHIVEIHHNMTYTIQHEWCDKQIAPINEKWKHSRLLYDSPLEKQLCSQNYITIRNANECTNPDIHTLLKEQNCHQMLILPLFESGSKFGFITFTQCKDCHEWTSEEIRILIDISSVLAIQLNNFHLINKMLHYIKSSKKQRKPVEILHTRLKKLHAELVPNWNQIKNANPDNHQKVPELANLDRHISTLDKICNTLSEK